MSWHELTCLDEKTADQELRLELKSLMGLDPHRPVRPLVALTPETVALAVMAEMQCLLTAREPIHLRERAAPIHG